MPKQSSRQQEIGDLFKSSYNTTSTGASTSTENNRSITQEANASSARQQEIAGLWGNRQVYTQPTTNAAKPNTPTTPKTTQATIAAQKAGNIMALGAGVPKTTKADEAVNAAIGYGVASFKKLLSDAARPTGELTMGESAQAAVKGISQQEAEKQKREKSKANEWSQRLNESAVDWYESAQENEAKAREGLGDFGNLLVSTGIAGTQMAGDLALNALVPGSGIFAMAGRAYGSGSLEAQANGLTAGQQQLAGLKSAAIETITEKIFGYGSKVAYGSGLVKSPQVIESAINTLAKTNAGRTALKVLVGANEEGLEEVLSDLLNPIADRLLGLDSGTGNVYEDLQAQQVLEDYLVGGILGLFGGGTQVISGETMRANEEQRASEQAQQDIVSKGLESAEGTHSRILAEEYNKILAESSKRGHRYLYDSEVNSLQTALDMESRQGSTPNANAFNTAQQAQAQQDTAMRMMGARVFGNNDISSDIAKAVAGNAKSSAPAQTTRSFTEVTSAISNSTQTTEQAQKLNATAKAVINGNEVSNSQLDALAENDSAMQAIAKYAGEELPTFKGTASEVRTAKRNWLKGISTATAQRIKQAQAQQAEKTAQRQTMPVVDYARKYGEDADKVVQAFSDGERIESNLFNAEFDAAYQLGKSGVDVDKAMAQKSIQDLSPSQRMVAYQMGVKAKSNTEQRKAKVKSKGNVSFDGETYTERGKTKTLPAVNLNGLTQEQKASIEVIKKIAEVTGINFVFYESEANEQGKYTESNGMFKGNTIYLDINAGKQFITDKSAILRTASHELTHYIQKHSPAQYAELKAFISQTLVENESLLGKGKTFDTLVANKAYTRGLSIEEATDEVIADACEMMLRDSKAVQTLAEENPTLFKTIRNWLREFCRKLRKAFEGVETAYTESTALLNELGRYTDELQRMWDNAFIDAVRSDFTEMENDAGETVVLADNNGHAQLSVRTYDEGGREQLENYLAKRVKEGAITTAERDDMLSQMEAMYKICKDYAKKYTLFGQWSEAEVRTDPITGEPIFSVVKANGEYALNLDFSLVCKKRRTLDAVFNEMISQGIMDDFDMVERSIAAINDLIRENDFETACSLCFVDTKRYRQAMVADSFVRIYNGLVRSMVKDGQKLSYFNFGEDKTIINPKDGIHTLADSELDFTKIEQFLHNPKYMPKAKKDGGMTTGSVEYRVAKLLKESPQDRKLLKRGDFMSTTGFDNLRQHNTRVLGLYNAKKGAGGPKAAQSDVQYLSEILAQKKFNADSAYKVGGVRVQSFSDYIPRLCFDYVQMMGDLAAKQLPAHAYTKEPLFALQFGRTGMKINMSLVPEVIEGGVAPGLDKDGNYAWRDGQSFGSTVYGGSEEFVRKCYDIIGKEYNGQDRLTAQEGYELAMAIQNADGYHNNCGTIAVGVSNAHILKLIRDPNIRMVIPYHKSSLNHLVAVMTNVDKYVNYTEKQNTRLASGKKLERGDFNFNEALLRLGDAKAAADEYLAWCDEHNYIPKFEDFRNEENYYKLLEDFTCYDRDGNAAPQGAVQVNFPTADDAFGSMSDLIEMGLIEDTNLNAKQTAKVPEIVKQIKATLPELEQKWKDEANAKKKPKKSAPKSKVQKSERDAEYLELAKDPEANRDKLQAMVDEAAKKAGYNSPMLYHGTNAFGFTKLKTEGVEANVQWSPFFTANREDISATYVKYGKVRGVSSELDEEARDDAIEEYKESISDSIWEFRRLIDRHISEWVFGQTDNSYLESLVENANPEAGYGDGVYDVLSEVVYDAFYDNSDLFTNYIDADDWAENSKEGNEIFGKIVEIEGKVAALHELETGGELGGIYQLYAKLDNLYVIDAQGKAWNELESKDLPVRKNIYDRFAPYKTRDVALWARDNGYDGVHFKNIRDNGAYGSTPAGDVYTFFKPQSQVKSADPVTYDDAGNVIPLSERFNAGNEDIRYSTRDSEGNELSPQQQEFFKDSKVRDEDGNLLVVYHGTDAEFTVFDRTKGRTNMDIQGMFFSPWELDAGGYGGNVGAYYINITNPASESMGYKALQKFKGQNGAGIKAREYLESLGYDGVNNGNEEYIAFNANQIKLTTNLNPTESEDIRYSERNRPLSDTEYKAIDVFGVTDDFAEAGYILSNGEMLKFTNDSRRGDRDYDHRAIAIAYGKDIDLSQNHGFDMNATPYLERFVEEGAVRIDVGSLDLNMDMGIQLSSTKPLTFNQEQTIRDLINWKNEREEMYNPSDDEFSLYNGPLAFRVEFGGDASYAVGGVNERDLKVWGVDSLNYYGKKIYPNKVISDIRYYYETGKIREQSELQQFRYSERDSDRELLSTALESAARTKTEKALIAQYKENLSTLEDRQRTLQQARKELSDARKSKDTARAKSLENTVETLAKSVNAADEKLLKLQATEPLRNVVKRARMEERRAAKVKRDEAVKKTKAQAAAQKKKELDRVREQRDKRIEQVKKHNDEVNRNKRERSNVTAEWHSIAKLGKRFQQLIDHPTQKDSGHAPVGICQSALKLCKCFEIADRKRVIGDVKGAINELKARYASIKDDSALGIFHEQEMYNVIDAVSNEINALDSTEALNAETLHKIVKMLKMLDRTMVNANKFLSRSIDKTIAQAGREWAKEINDATPMLKGKIGQFLNWQLRPDTFFKRLSGFAKNSMGEQIQAMFTEGTEKKLKVQQDFYLHFKDLTERKEYLELGRYKDEDLVDVGLVDADGNSILVTRDMMLAIYKHLSSNDNFMAVAYGGFAVPDLADYYRGKSKSAYDKSVLSDCMDAHMWEVQTEIMRIKAMISATEDEMQKQALKESLAELEIEADLLEREAFNKVQEIYINIQEKLTEYERELLDASTRWMDKSADYINEETMRMYGIEKAKVDNYWTIHRDTNFINTDLRTAVNDINLENWGSLKERVQSHAPVLLTGFAFELDNHTRRMSDFVGYAAVQRDFSKLYNTKLPAMRSSLARIVQQKFGSDNWLFGQSGQSYIDEYISAVSGSVQNGDALSNLYGNLAQATLSLNLRVAVSQLASIPTAAAEVGWGNVARGLGEGFKIAFSKTAKEELVAKDPWYFQRYRGEGGMVEIASMKDASNFIGRQWNKLARSKVGSKLVNWCQDFDAFATSMMWAMAEEQVKENGGKPGDSNYDRLVSNVYRDIIRKTQPNYTVTERSGLLRDKRGGMKFLTMYKTQSNQNLNILYEASATLRKYKQDFANGKNGVTKADIKKAQKAVAQGYTAVLIGGTLAFSILRFLANAIMHSLDNYRDDEDDLTLMSILGGITKETVSATAGMVAFGGQVYDFVLPLIEDGRYYGLSDSAFAALSNVLEDGYRLITKDDRDFEDFYKVFKDISNVLGLPINNVRKLVDGARYHIEDIINGEFLSYEAGVERSQAVMAGKILDAVRAGDTDTADELFADAVESSSAQEPEKAVKAKVKSALKDAYNAGEIDDAEAQKILQDYFGYDKNAAYFEMKKFSEDVSSTYSPLYDALESGNRSDIRKEINDLLDHGKEEKDIKQSVTGHYREAYRNGSNEERMAIRKAMYASGLWDSSDEIIALCNKWLESK